MAYRITEVKLAYFPNAIRVCQALADIGLPEEHLRNAIERFVCDAPLIRPQGYTQVLATALKSYLERVLPDSNDLRVGSTYYSARLNERADLAIQQPQGESRIYVEVEFRPNVEKDLIKFQIGYNAGRLAAAVLILAIDRNRINPKYTTMPEFSKFAQVIEELRPVYPLLLVGIAGEHVDIGS